MDRNQRLKNEVKKNTAAHRKAIALMQREQPKVDAIRAFRTKPYEAVKKGNEV